MTKEIILDCDSRAAERVGPVFLWKSARGHYYLKEGAARSDGATHVRCGCGALVVKHYLKCDSCREEAKRERYEALPRQEWDGETPLYSETADEYFFSRDELLDYLMENEGTPETLRLVLCTPNKVSKVQLDAADYLVDMVPDEGGEVPEEVAEAFDELNRKLRACNHVLSWEPGKVAAVIDV